MLNGINHITVAVSDLDRSLDFYVNHLGFTPHVRWDGGAYLTLAETWFCLSIDHVSPNEDYSHIALDISEDKFDSFIARLQSLKTLEWKHNSSEGNSIYFLDAQLEPL